MSIMDRTGRRLSLMITSPRIAVSRIIPSTEPLPTAWASLISVTSSTHAKRNTTIGILFTLDDHSRRNYRSQDGGFGIRGYENVVYM